MVMWRSLLSGQLVSAFHDEQRGHDGVVVAAVEVQRLDVEPVGEILLQLGKQVAAAERTTAA